jgi:hypothetical protein
MLKILMGKKPLDYAIESNQLECIEILKKLDLANRI